LSGLDARLRDADSVLMDSIWLTESHAGQFLALVEQGRSVGVMLHSFPSMIAAAEAGLPAPARPTRFELETIARLGLVVVPGLHYAAWLGETSATIIVAEPGIEEHWRAPPRPRSGPCQIVSVGSVTPRKGFIDVAEVLARRANADYHWTVIGNLNADVAYAERLRGVALPPGAMTLRGQLPPSEVAAHVQRADVFVLSSYDENQPLVLLEALAASVPSVAYAAGAARQMVEHGRQGFVAEIGDRVALERHIGALISNEALRFELAQACWRGQAALPTWSGAAERARAALERAFDGRGKGAGA
jgi:hypothetical protein